jgi:hypothetical protein
MKWGIIYLVLPYKITIHKFYKKLKNSKNHEN